MPAGTTAAAMAMVSSGESFFAPGTGTRPPATRIIGVEPAFRWRSDAPFSTAVVSRSLICMGQPLTAAASAAMAGAAAS